MFKFLKFKRKKERAAIEAPINPADITAQQLVERFHSESALCDPSRRRLLLDAAVCTQDEIELRALTVDVRHRAGERCRELGQLQQGIVTVRQSQDDMRQCADIIDAHMKAHNAAVDKLEETAQHTEDRFDSLVRMAANVEQASQMLSDNMQALARRPSRRRKPPKRNDIGEQGMAALLDDGEQRLAQLQEDLKHMDLERFGAALGDLEVLVSEFEKSIRRRAQRVAQLQEGPTQVKVH
jgi:hypothetical protein